MAEAADESLRELSRVLKGSATMTALGTRQLLGDLGLPDEQQELDEEILEEVAAALEKAEGEAGDRVKYKEACKSMLKRWKLFLAVHSISEDSEPTLNMVKTFCAFMYKHRQRLSTIGRQGLGDAVAKMAKHVRCSARASRRPGSEAL